VSTYLGEEINQALDGIAPSACRGFSSLLKQQSGLWLPPGIWLTFCVLIACCLFLALLRLARGPAPRP
jgi:hypothetical protein